MVTAEKLNWPLIGPPPANIHEHILLALNANQAMVEMIENNSRKDKRPSTDILLLHLRGLNDALCTFLTQSTASAIALNKTSLLLTKSSSLAVVMPKDLSLK